MSAAPAPSPALFRPSAEITDALIAAISDPTLSFQELAAQHNTTPEALAAWMIRPEIRQRLESIDSITTWRTRLTASAQLNSVVRTLSTILDNFCERGRAATSPLHAGSSPASEHPTSDTPYLTSRALALREQYIQVRAEDTARKSAALLLLRLANVRPVAAHDQLAPATLAAPASAQAPAAPSKPSASPFISIPRAPITPPAPPRPTTQPQRSPASNPAPPYVPSVPWVPSDLSLETPTTPAAHSPSAHSPAKHTKRPNSPTHLLAAATREHWP